MDNICIDCRNSEGCKHKPMTGQWTVAGCSWFVGDAVITNYDRLISKTPEELAKYISEFSNGDCPTVGDCPEGIRENETCTPWQCWLYWLKSPADQEE